MPAHLLIGAGAGLVSAALFASAVLSAAIAGMILNLCPLPLFLAGFGWGRPAVALAGVVGMLAGLLFLGPSVGVVYAITIALPAASLVHLSLQSRAMVDPADPSKPVFAWYPAGRIVAAAAVMGGMIAGLMTLTLGPSMTSYQASIDALMPAIHDTLGQNKEVWTPEVAESVRTLLTRALPGALATVWVLFALFNMWLAGTIVKGFGHALRPWPNLHAIDIPNVAVIGFAVSLALSFIPGMVGLIATGFAAALLIAYLVQGLAFIHFHTVGMPFRTGLLAVLYLSILLLGWPAIIVAILGLAEPLIGLRARDGTSANPTDKQD